MTREDILGFSEWLPPFAVGSLLTLEECVGLRALAESSDLFVPAKVIRQDGKVGSDPAHCRAEMACFRANTPVYDHAKRRIVSMLKAINRRYQFDLFDPEDKRFMPFVSIMRYNEGTAAEFKPHVDMTGRVGVEHRKLSLVIPLNDPDEYEGGRLIIDTGERFDASAFSKSGEVVVFSSMTMHSVTPVVRGTRYSLVTFLHGPRFR